MTTISDLSKTLNTWTRRLRFQRALTWSLRGLIIGLALALLFGMFGLFQFNLLRSEFLALVISLALISPVIASLIAYFWPVQPMQAARYFDRTFHLGERISTALELDSENIHTDITSRQLEDAVRISKKVKLNHDLPLRLKKKELSYALIVFALISLVWFRGEQFFTAAAQARAVQQAVAEQAANIEETIQKIEANQNLTEQQKEELTAPLEQALEQLQENPSLEGAVSVLTNTSEKLEALSSEQTEQMSQALQQTGGELAQQEGSPLQGVGENLAEGNPIAAANELANVDTSQLSSSEAGELASQLDTLADALQSTNPQLAEQLNQAAQALQNGDMAAAQEALDKAAQMMAQAGQQIAQSQTAGQTAQQLQQGAGQVVAAGGGQQTAQAGQNGQGQQGSNQSGQSNGGSGSGTGSGSEAQGSQSGDEASSSPIDQNNGAGDGGLEGYEQIYAPSLLGGEDGLSVALPNSGEEGDVIGEGPTDPSQPGESLVPYSEVFSQYYEFNREAIESGQIPVEFMDIIRNYFDSLKP